MHTCHAPPLDGRLADSSSGRCRLPSKGSRATAPNTCSVHSQQQRHTALSCLPKCHPIRVGKEEGWGGPTTMYHNPCIPLMQ